MSVSGLLEPPSASVAEDPAIALHRWTREEFFQMVEKGLILGSGWQSAAILLPRGDGVLVRLADGSSSWHPAEGGVPVPVQIALPEAGDAQFARGFAERLSDEVGGSWAAFP